MPPPEKWISSHLPRDSTLVDDLAGERRVVVEAREQRIGGAEAGDGLAAEGAAERARGAEDGVAFRHWLLELLGRWIVMRQRQRDAAQVHAERAGIEAGIHEEAGHGMRGDRLAVDGGDEHALMAARRACVPDRGRRGNGRGRRRPASAPALRREGRRAGWDCCGAATRPAGRCAG